MRDARSSLSIGLADAAAVPESPRYLYMKGRDVDARHVFGRMLGFAEGSVTALSGDFKLSDDAQEEYDAMCVAIDEDKRRGLDKWSAFYNTGSARYRLYVSLSSQFWWAWNGSSVLTCVSMRAATR